MEGRLRAPVHLERMAMPLRKDDLAVNHVYQGHSFGPLRLILMIAEPDVFYRFCSLGVLGEEEEDPDRIRCLENKIKYGTMRSCRIASFKEWGKADLTDQAHPSLLRHLIDKKWYAWGEERLNGLGMEPHGRRAAERPRQSG